MFWFGFACGVAAFLGSAIIVTIVADRIRMRRRPDAQASQRRDLPINTLSRLAANENRAARMRVS